MNEKSLNVFIDFGSSKIRLGIYNKETSKNIIILEKDCISNSKVKIICEKNSKKINELKKKYPNKLIVSDENKIYLDKSINLVCIASYDNFHFNQIVKSIESNKNIIVEKPMCLKLTELIKIKKLLKKKPNIKMVSNLVLRTNDLFLNFKKQIEKKKTIYIEADYLWGRKHKLSGWRNRIKDYSITLGAGIHMVDLVMWLLKLKPTSVQVFGTKKGNIGSSFTLLVISKTRSNRV